MTTPRGSIRLNKYVREQSRWTQDKMRAQSNRRDVAKDASERRFFLYAQYEGGVNVPIWETSDIEKAMPMIRQAHELAKA